MASLVWAASDYSYNIRWRKHHWTTWSAFWSRRLVSKMLLCIAGVLVLWFCLFRTTSKTRSAAMQDMREDICSWVPGRCNKTAMSAMFAKRILSASSCNSNYNPLAFYPAKFTPIMVKYFMWVTVYNVLITGHEHYWNLYWSCLWMLKNNKKNHDRCQNVHSSCIPNHLSGRRGEWISWSLNKLHIFGYLSAKKNHTLLMFALVRYCAYLTELLVKQRK